MSTEALLAAQLDAQLARLAAQLDSLDAGARRIHAEHAAREAVELERLGEALGRLEAAFEPSPSQLVAAARAGGHAARLTADDFDESADPETVYQRLRAPGALAARIGFVRAAGQRAKAPGVETEFCVSSEMIASDGLKIARKAWNPYLPGGARHHLLPPFVASHKTSGPAGELTVLARIVPSSVRWETGEGLVCGVVWATADVNPHAPRYQSAYAGGFLRGVSIAWGDTKFADRPDPATNAPVVIGLRWDEFSAVVSPADPGARVRP